MTADAAAILRAADTHVLVTHVEPDGDAAGTALALGHALRSLGKRVTLLCVDPIPPAFRFLPGWDAFQRDCMFGDVDVVTVIDCGDLKRTGIGERLRSVGQGRRRILNIDHHQRNDLHKVAHHNYVDTAASSAAELVLPLIKALGAPITKDIATCLLTGLYYDTGGFKHSNTSERVLRQASELLAAGARLKHIRHFVSSYRSVPSLRLWGLALSRIHYHERLRIVASVLTAADFAACDASPEDMAGCVNLLNCVPEAAAAILVAELPDGTLRASLRTERDAVDVGALAQLFGGGGIRKAAGFALKGQLLRSGSGEWSVALPSPGPVELVALPVPARALAHVSA